jgi:hypothetical protein
MKSPDPRHSASRLGAESSQFLPSIQASSDALPVGYPRMPRLLVHGGAWAIPASEEAAHEAGVRRALEAGYAVLERGGPALDAVVAAVMVLEDDETFDAGRGSFLTADGRVQLDALLMDGGRMKAGGVACVERLRNPIKAARLVLEESPHVYFVGEGAERFAAAHGMELIENGELVLDRERVRLRAAQERAARGLKDETFSGELLDDKGPETAMHQGLGTEEQGTGNEERGTGTEEQGIGNREQGTERPSVPYPFDFLLSKRWESTSLARWFFGSNHEQENRQEPGGERCDACDGSRLECGAGRQARQVSGMAEESGTGRRSGQAQ